MLIVLLITQLSPAPELQPTELQLLQQHLVEQSQSFALDSEITESTENSLLLQIQALTEQLLASTAVSSSDVQPQSETALSDTTYGKVVFCFHFVVMFWMLILSDGARLLKVWESVVKVGLKRWGSFFVSLSHHVKWLWKRLSVDAVWTMTRTLIGCPATAEWQK